MERRSKWVISCFILVSAIIILSPTALAEAETDVKEWLPQPLVIIDAGHGGLDGGAQSHNVKEKDINLKVAQKLYLILQSENITAILNRTGDYALSDENRWHRGKSRHLRDLSQRSALAKQLDHAIFISIHCNAAPSSHAHGPLVIHQKTGESYLLASLLQNKLNEVYNTFRKPVGASSFYLLKYVNKPSVIVELGFISNYHDRQMLSDQVKQTDIAQALASAISHYFIINN